jgi:thioredoxin reductase (NADPH)
MKDLTIIGAGPAGLTAAIYGMRAGLDLLVVERLSPGGQVMNTYEIENYPGFVDPIPGWELVSSMENQAKRLGAEIISNDIAKVERKLKDGLIRLTPIDGEPIDSRAVIVATGTTLKKLGVPGEDEFIGRGVSYCATCDGAFYRDRITVVVGGGDTALEEALFLTRFAKKVYLVHRRDEFRGTKILQKRVLSNEKIEPVYDTIVTAINGREKVNAVTIKNKKTGAEGEITTDGVFLFIGYQPNTNFLPKEILNEKGEVRVDMMMKTPIEGIFAAGDLRENSIRQVVAAAADGATAVLSAYEYVTTLGT